MITTTLNRILARGPCGQAPDADGELSGWLKLLAGLGKSGPDDEPLPYAEILRINGDAERVTQAILFAKAVS